MKSFTEKLLFIVCLVIISNTYAFGAAKTWVGAAGGGSWSTAANWSPASIPSLTDDIIINAGTSAMSFTGMSSQTIASLTINGTTGSVTWSSGASTLTITGNFTSAVNTTTGVITISTAGSGSSIAAGKTLTISSASQLTIPIGGVFTVNGTITSVSAGTAPIGSTSNTRVIVPSGGVINYNCGSSLATMPLMTVNAGGTLNITSSNTVTLNSFSMAGKLSIASTGSTAISTSGNAPSYQTGSTLEYLNCTAIPENSSAWPTGTSGPTNVIVNSPNGVTITSTLGRQIKGTLTLTSGALVLSGSSNTLTFNGTGSVAPIVRTSGTITTTSSPNISFSPTAAANWVIPAGTYTTAPTFTGFTSAMGSGGSLTMNEQFVTVSGTFTLTSGLVTLGTGDLQVATMSFFTPSATRMITTSSTSGFLKHSFNTSSFQSFLYPIGDLSVTAEYSGFTFNLNSNSATRVIGFKVVDAAHPNINSPSAATNYLSRYWPSTVAPSSGTYDYSIQLPYNGTTGDINGTEANIGVAAWNGSSAWNAYDGSINVSSNFLDISGGTQTTSPLGFDITGRQRDDDDCAGAINLGTIATSGCTNGVFNTQGASQSSTGCAGTADDDVWFKFTLPVGYTSVNFSTTNISGSTDRVFQFYSGTCGSLTSLLCSDPESGQVTGLTGGQTYYFRVYTWSSGTTSNGTICLSLPPANNDCAGAIPFGTLVTGACANSQNVNTVSASQSLTGCTGTADDDVWYSFVLPTGYTSVNFSTTNISGSTDRVFQFYSGTCGSLTSLLCSDPESGQVSGLTAGVTYYVRAYTFNSGAVSNFTLCLTLPPINDNCAGAIPFGTLVSGACANSQNVNTLNASQSSSGCAGTADDDVWYSFVLPANYTSVNFSTTNISGNTDRVFQFYSGSCGSLTSVLCSDPESGVVTGLTAGVTYYVRAYTFNSGVTSNFTLCLTLPPANDNCAGAVSMGTLTTGGCNNATFNTFNSSQSSIGCTGTADDDIWYSFVMPTGFTSLSFSTTNISGSTDIVYQFYSGSCGSLTSLLCSDPETGQLTGLTPGATYYFRVYTYFSGSVTNGTICISLPPANDECAGAITLPVNSSCITTGGTTLGATSSGVNSCGSASDDVWYSFTAPVSTSVALQVTGTGGFNPALNLRGPATCPAFGTNIVCYDFAGTNGTETLKITDLVAGSVYKVRVSRSFLTSGTFNICAASTYTPSGNDNVANALTANIGSTVGNTNSTYGIQLGEPAGSDWLITGGVDEPTNSQWFKFTPTVTGCYSIASTGFDTQLAIYSASNLSNWNTFSELASDEDNGPNAGYATFTSYIDGVTLTAFTTYYIQVSGYPYVSGTPTLIISNPLIAAAPVAQAATLPTCAGFTANWLASSNSASYQIDVATDINFTNIVLSTSAGTGTSYAVTGLSGATTYYYRIRGVNACGNASSNSGTITVVTSGNVGTPLFTAGATTLCAGASSTYIATATGTTGITYSIFSGGATIDANTGTVSNVTSDFVVRASAAGCGGPTTVDISVSVISTIGNPVFTAGSATLCVGGTNTYTATAVGATTIAYSIFTGGATINASSGLVSNVTGNFTVRATATGNCGGPTTADFVVTVSPVVGTPTFTAGAATLCTGGTDTYTASATNSTTITYSILNGGATINANTGVVNNVTGNFTVRATATGTCGGPTTADFVVTVSPVVATPSFTAGAATLCTGGTDTYTASATNSTTITYSILNGGATIDANTGVVNNVTGNFTVRATATGTCGGPTTTDFVVTVSPVVGTPSFTAGAATLCAGATETYTATAANSTGITYSIFTGGATINASSGLVSNVIGNFTVRATATGTCGGPTTADFVVTVSPLLGTPSFTTGATTLCTGGISTYTATAANSTGIVYSIFTGGATINASSGLVSNVTGNFTVRATATGTCGGPTTTDFVVTVTPNVGTPNFTAGSATLCAGGTSTYTATAANSTGVVYSIQSGGATINPSTGVVSNVTADFVVLATATGTCGTPTTATFSVSIVNSVGIPSFTAGAAALCVGGSSTYIANASGASTITYSIVGSGATIDASSGLVSNVTGNFTVRATATGNCGGPTTADFIVTITPTVGTPTFTAGASTLCIGGASTYTATAANSSGITYSILTGGATINASSGLVSNVIGNFTVRATATGTCGGPTTTDFVVTVTPNVGTPNFTAGSATLCAGGTSTYTATAANSTGVVYSIQSGGATINPSTGVVSNVTDSFTVRATASGACGNSTTADFVVSVTPNVGTPSFTAGAAALCEGTSSTYTATATNSTGITYSILSGGATINATTGVASNVTGNFTVQATATGACGNSTTADFVVTVNPTTTITTQPQTQSVCANGQVTFSVVADGQITGYQWNYNNNPINNATNSSYTINPVSVGDAGNYTVALTGGCGNANSQIAILTVNAALSITQQPQTQTICENDTLTLSVATNVNAQYQWQLNGNDIQNATSSDYVLNGVTLAQAGTYSVDITSGCGNATSNNAVLTVVPNITNTKNRTICNGSVFEFAGQFLTEEGTYIGYYPASNGCDSIVTLNLSVTGPTATISLANNVDLSTNSFNSYQWLLNGSPISGATSQTYTATANGNYQVIVFDAGGCSDTSDVVNVTGVSVNEASSYGLGVYPNPTINFVYLKGQNLPAGKLTYMLSDVTGRLLEQAVIATLNGVINERVNIGVYAPGVYMLTVSNANGHLQTFRVIRAE